MQLHTLKSKTVRKKSRQVGRGGTRGKTSGRGTKGQNARAGHKKRPELRDFIKRFPKLRGRGVSSLKSYKSANVAINLSKIEALFSAGENVTRDSLIEKKVVSIKKGSRQTIKVLGTGDLTKKLSFSGLEVSETAKKKIEALGGEVR
jgi:large subunit ribosomal protein L15